MEVKEVIIYTIKEAHRANTKALLTELRQMVKELKGFKDIASYQSFEHPERLMDHVTWESIEDARAAIDTFKNHPAYGAIVSKFDETIHFDHYYFFM
ncbi:MAG: hypothetical protein AAFO69_16970 [Bacteroidota bacterium]